VKPEPLDHKVLRAISDHKVPKASKEKSDRWDPLVKQDLPDPKVLLDPQAKSGHKVSRALLDRKDHKAFKETLDFKVTSDQRAFSQ
jgi:hypothetical protein